MDAHRVKPGFRRLMLVVVARTSVDLADAFRFQPAEHFGKHPYF